MQLELCNERRKLLQTSGHMVVRGGAGSGKTTIALAKASTDLFEGKLGQEGKALFLSFARATVARVAEQATAILPRESAGKVEINTYHGFAWSVLKSHGYLLSSSQGISLLLPAQCRGRLAGVSDDKKHAKLRAMFVEKGLAAFDIFPNLITELFAKLPILANAYGQSYPLIIVDEFQDTNAAEWAMIELLGQRSTIIALGDPKQRIYEFKGADPRRFDDFIQAFRPAEFDFKSENRRSGGTEITNFADDVLSGSFRAAFYNGVSLDRYQETPYRGMTLSPLKRAILTTAGRLRRMRDDWSLAVLVPTNSLAANVFHYMRQPDHGLPSYPIDILVSAEGPMLSSNVIALLMEPREHNDELGALILTELAAFELGRSEKAASTQIANATRYRKLAGKVRSNGAAALNSLVVGQAVANLVDQVAALTLTGDPMTDWRAVRAVLDDNPRAEIKVLGKEARYMRLLQRGAQIENHFAEAWRACGCYKNARELLRSAIVEDQFAAMNKPQRGVTVMTIHKAKGKEFDEVIVFESSHVRFVQRPTAEGHRSARYNLHVAATRGRYARFLRVLITAAIDRLTAEPGGHPVLMILDEFARLEQLPAVSNAFGFAAGFNLQLWPFLQDLPQLEDLYGKRWMSLLANCGMVQFFTPVDVVTAEFLQRRGGLTTGESRSRSYSGSVLKGERSESRSEARVPLLPMEESMSLAADRSVVFFAGRHDPLRVGRQPYWTIPRLKGLFDPDPFHLI